MTEYVITETGHRFMREHVVMNFSFLQANDIGLVFINNRCQLMEAGTESIDIKRDEFHNHHHCDKVKRCGHRITEITPCHCEKRFYLADGFIFAGQRWSCPAWYCYFTGAFMDSRASKNLWWELSGGQLLLRDDEVGNTGPVLLFEHFSAADKNTAFFNT